MTIKFFGYLLKYYRYFFILTYILGILVLSYFLFINIDCKFKFRVYFSHNIFDWFLFPLTLYLLYILIMNIVRKQQWLLLLLNLLFSGFLFSFLFSGGELISNRIISIFSLCDKKDLGIALNIFLSNNNISVDDELNSYLISFTDTKFELYSKLNYLYIINKFEGSNNVISLNCYLFDYIRKYDLYFYIYSIIMIILFFYFLLLNLNKVKKVNNFEKQLLNYYKSHYSDNANLLVINNILNISYSGSSYRNVEVNQLYLFDANELFLKYGRTYLDNLYLTSYEFSLPFQLEFINSLNLNKTGNNFCFINIILFSDNVSVLEDYLLLHSKVFNLEKKKINFIFTYESLAGNYLEEDEFFYVYDMLVCVDKIYSENFIDMLKKNLCVLNSMFNLVKLDNIDNFFNRSIYYKKINKSININSGFNFIFFKYNFDLYVFYIMGEFIVSMMKNNTMLNNVLKNMYFSNLNEKYIFFNTLFEAFNLCYYIPSGYIKYNSSYIFMSSLFTGVFFKKKLLEVDNNFFLSTYVFFRKINLFFLKIYYIFLDDVKRKSVNIHIYLLIIEISDCLDFIKANDIEDTIHLKREVENMNRLKIVLCSIVIPNLHLFDMLLVKNVDNLLSKTNELYSMMEDRLR